MTAALSHDITIPDPTGRTNESARVLIGDCIERLKGLPDGSVHTCITSPPYFGLRSYLPSDHPDKAKELGLEKTPREFVDALVAVFREVHRVLRDDGTLWLNIGDGYTSGNRGYRAPDKKNPARAMDARPDTPEGLKPKDLIGIPWRLAFALQEDGWYLRQDVIWAKPNGLPESVTDRCTKSHEYIFLLTKSPRYYFDAEAIKEPAVGGHSGRAASFRREGSKRAQAIPGQSVGTHRADRDDVSYDGDIRNRRSVWTVSTKPYRGAHFAVFPPELIEPCILAGCPAGGVVLDPFGGSGTTAGVSLKHARSAIVCELNAESVALMPDRIMDICRPEDAPTRVVNDAQVELFGSEVAP